MHVWSLGVEEQFYIVFPLLVVLCIRWRKDVLVPVTSALILLSLLTNIGAIRMGESTPAFFFLPMRAWELGAGALLALTPPSRPLSAWLRQALACVAAGLLILGVFFNFRVLGGLIPIALWTVLGATLVIHLGRVGGSWLTSCFSLGGMVWVGLISYSLYLWHWPILVFARYYLVVTTLSPLQAIGALILMFGMATVSWRFVERPFRDRTMPIRRVLIWTAIGCMVVAAASGAMLAYRGLPSRFSADVARINSAVGTEYRCGLKDYISFGALHGCLMALPSRDPKDASVALLGNSHAQMYAPLVSDILRVNHRGGILVPLAGCLPMPGFNLSETCMGLAAENLSAIEAMPHIRIVVISMTWGLGEPMYTNAGPVPEDKKSAFFLASIDNLIASLKQQGRTVVLVGPISYPGRDEASIVARQLAFHHNTGVPLFAAESTFMASQGDAIAHFASRKDIVFIRADQVQCNHGRCEYFHDGESLFADDNHIAQAALPLFRPAFEPALRQAFLQSTQQN